MNVDVLNDVVGHIEDDVVVQTSIDSSLQASGEKALTEELAAKATVRDGLKFVSAVIPASDPEALRSIGSQILAKLGDGVVQLGAAFGDRASVVVFCSPAAVKAGHQAGKLVQELSLKLGGKGGGKPDFAMGGGKDTAKLADVLG